MRIKGILVAAAFAGLFAAANAAPITYTLSGPFDGTIAGTPVTGATFTWTVTADTNAVSYIPFYDYMPATSSTIDISGFGTLTTTSQFAAVFAPSYAEAAFEDVSSSSGLTEMVMGGVPLLHYDGLSAKGPVALWFVPMGVIATDQGDVIMTSSQGLYPGVFQATGGRVPEPVTLALFGAGLAGIGALRRKASSKL